VGGPFAVLPTLAVARRLSPRVTSAASLAEAAFRRSCVSPLSYAVMLGASGNLFTLSEMILLSCMTCWLKAAYSTISR